MTAWALFLAFIALTLAILAHWRIDVLNQASEDQRERDLVRIWEQIEHDGPDMKTLLGRIEQTERFTKR